MRSFFILTAFAYIISAPLLGQNDDIPSFEDTIAVYEEIFDISEPLTLTMKFDIKEFQKTKHKGKYHPALMTCHVGDGFDVSHNVRVRARGEYRLNTCSMPPYWLNIRHAGIEAETLSGVIKVKMVTRCGPSKMYENYVLREYLMYRIYNLLSPYSFNTRLVKLKYVDTGRKDKVSEDWGFIIEPEAMMAERNKAMAIKNDKLSLATVNKEWMDKVAYFNYMVGMCDFSVTGRHNLKILTPKEFGSTGFIPVPYDFDYSGLVDAHYAVPGEGLGTTSVRERYYLGACRSEELHEQTIRWLASFQDEITDLIRSFEYLEESERKDMIDYLDTYFEEAERKGFIKRSIDPTCR